MQAGQVKYVPIEYSQWEDVLRQLPEKIAAKIDRMKRGGKKQAAQVKGGRRNLPDG